VNQKRKSSIDRREFLKLSATAALSLGAGTEMSVQRRTTKMNLHVAVVGAGAFGGWTALQLVRRKARVTVIDAWGPGNARASSGGETRVIRAIYGPERLYVQMVKRSLEFWRDYQLRWRRRLYHHTGVLWMVSAANNEYVSSALPHLRDARLRFEEMSPAEAAKRYSQISFDGVQRVVLERQAGYLLARQACAAVLEACVRDDAKYQQAEARPGAIVNGRMQELRLSDGTTIKADAFVFACGPWLGKIFPELLAKRITPTRQEVFFFGTAPGDVRFTDDALPAWIDLGEHAFYGIPGNQWRGFKLADDTRGTVFDPTTGDRTPSAEGIRAAHSYLARRFPALKDAPLLEARVCQYENSTDGNLILDRHPEAENVWIAGGGSGHGFKLGPAVGEMMSAMMLDGKPPEPQFTFARFEKRAGAGSPLYYPLLPHG
jgi:glycine/D-amino acid oxidase-like deaminating enzyme